MTRAAGGKIGGKTGGKPNLRGLRERRRADGSVRFWWEPSAAARAAGFAVTEFATRGAAERGAARMNADVDRALASGTRATPRATGTTVDQLVSIYTGSTHFRLRLKPATQADYRKLFSVICDKWGPVPVADFTKGTIATWYDSLAATGKLRMAQALIRAFSILFSEAERRDLRPQNSNPCLRMKVVTPAPRARVCSWAEYDALVAAADALALPGLRLAIAMAMLTGQRQTDILAARRADFYQVSADLPEWGGAARMVWVWDLTRSKRGNAGMILLHAELAPLIAAAVAQAAGGTADDDAPLIADGADGRGALTPNLFNKRWRAVRDRAAKAMPSLATLKYRDLRRSFGTHAEAGGASTKGVGDALGNSLASNARLRRTYLPPQFQGAARAVLALTRPEGPNQNTTPNERKTA